tara:strand:- start:23 stop:214 length:192 start_codon:yes stop_codon:yes gene_type:complete
MNNFIKDIKSMTLKYYSAAKKLMADIAIEENVNLRSLKHLGITKADIKRWIKYEMEKKDARSN